MAADGLNADSEDLEFDPRSGELECTEEHIQIQEAPDEDL